MAQLVRYKPILVGSLYRQMQRNTGLLPRAAPEQTIIDEWQQTCVGTRIGPAWYSCPTRRRVFNCETVYPVLTAAPVQDSTQDSVVHSASPKTIVEPTDPLHVYLMASASSDPPPVCCFDFRINGKVQGVYFRKSTQAQAVSLGVTGWVANDPVHKDVVIGHAEGSVAAMTEMRRWLSTVGSPTCRIDGAAFTKVATAARARAFKTFEVRKLGALAKRK